MRRLSSVSLPTRQRGLAVLVLLALFATAAAFMLVSALNKGSVAFTLARAEKGRTALKDAKAALIAWSAAQALLGTTLRPGSLPCPDRNNDGIAEATCGSANRLGRLPYITLGIEPLYDASGELLWYGLSGNFRTTSTINSDTAGQLTIYNRDALGNETIAQSGTVAVLLAPGMRVGTQSRTWSGASCSATSDPCNTASNYLEGRNGDTTTTDYVTAAENLTDSVVAKLFNDQLLAITRDDLFAAVEPVIAARIERDIVRQYIYDSDTSLTDSSNQWSDTSSDRNKSRYFDAWGAFPFAAPFADPSTSSFAGQASPATHEGLLPVVNSMTLVGGANYTWTLGSGTVVDISGSGAISSFNCGATTSASLKCNITSSGFISQPTFRMSGTVANVGRAFVQLPRLSDVSCSSCGAGLSARRLSGGLTSAGAGIVSLTATMPFSFGGTTVTITITNSNLIDSPLISTTDGFSGWFNTNGWYKQTYYAVSPGYVPGGAGNCNPSSSPYCLTVDNLAAPTGNKRAIVILAGRSLSGAARPNSNPADYLEGKNDPTTTNISTGDYAFEHSLRASTTVAGTPVAINDRVIVVAP